MEAALAVIEDDSERNEMQKMRPEHVRVIGLRLQGKRWSEIAAELGVRPETVWRWRQDHPEIDETIMQESQDFLESSKHGLAALVPKAVKAIGEEIDNPTPFVGATRVAASRYVIDKFSRAGDLHDRGGPIGKAARLPDDALDAALEGGGPTEPES